MMIPKFIPTLILASLATIVTALEPSNPCDGKPTPPKHLTATVECSRCTNHLLPGRLWPAEGIAYTIHSDLPEMFSTSGVLYSTEPVRPPFTLKSGEPLGEEMRLQKNNGFKTIDGNFEVFLFHISQPGDGTAPRRIVVYARNVGKSGVAITPRQVIVTDGVIGTKHDMENTLGRRVLSESWDRPLGATSIEPGKGAVIAYSKQFSTGTNDADSSANVNCLGIVRADVASSEVADAPNLQVFIVAIPAGETSTMTTEAESHLATGAGSQEGVVDLASEPSGCQLRRATGVMHGCIFKNEPITIDVDQLVANPIAYQMALPAVQSKECPEARQTADFLLYPPASRPDSVGNYMMEYELRLHLINRNPTETRVFDLRFGKSDADVGLAWQIAPHFLNIPAAELKKEPVRTGWAGPKQLDDQNDTRSFLAEDEQIIIGPCEEDSVTLRFMILGNSSLPFQIHATGKEQ
ncbi:hypothetical protein IT570_13645 [Candidatus Sumerlaeota bacterium]|nr:hypothetical protein [Candidatus Sumerlaeota bacterium]